MLLVETHAHDWSLFLPDFASFLIAESEPFLAVDLMVALALVRADLVAPVALATKGFALATIAVRAFPMSAAGDFIKFKFSI